IDTSVVGSDCDKTKDNYNKIFTKFDLSKKIKLPNSNNIFYLNKEHYEIESISKKDRLKSFYFENIKSVFRTAPNDEKTIRGIIADSGIEDDFFIVEKDDTFNFIYKNEDVLMLEKFCRVDAKNKVVVKMDYLTNIFTDDFWQGISNEGQVKLKNGKKPEALLKRIIEISTNENDLVMDFFAGSGTTLAVAMKMKRQFIGIEQMDYIESITKERLKKVVSGEQGGISKAVDWQGGGSFIYAELMPLNVAYKERIKNINDEKMLDSIYKDLESKAFLDYRIDLDSILKDKEFKELDLQEKKEVLLDILDSNMDYVLYGDIEDKDYAISSEVIELNRIFYGDCHDFANAKSRNDKKGK
ncbi:site-specific DNA-methyltransferase, partial [Campylobacter helveticus]|uniref:DNA methyltransferase n=1 Tax=Campylobacter helveticus TaxID=28898 RepID=UPI001116AA12